MDLQTASLSDLIREMDKVNAELQSPNAKGKVSALKAYYRKLAAAYRKKTTKLI